RQVLARDTERAEALLRSVEAGGREAMSELRTLLGLLSDDTTDAPLAPRPGLDQIEALVDRIRDAGMPVELTVDGTTRPLPPGIDLAAYRIVQEALTNALRHGKTGPVRLVIRYTETALELEVLDKAKPFLSLLEVARTRPDVILMDIRMPEIDGFEAARQILDAHRPRPRIIMLTTFDLDEYVYAALSARASGFLLKDTAPERLAAAVRLVADG